MAKKKPLEGNLKIFVDDIVDNLSNYYVGPKVQKAITMFRKERNLLYIDKTEDGFKPDEIDRGNYA